MTVTYSKGWEITSEADKQLKAKLAGVDQKIWLYIKPLPGMVHVLTSRWGTSSPQKLKICVTP